MAALETARVDGPALERAAAGVCQDLHGRLQVPKPFHFIDALTRTATGKVQRARLRA